MQNLMQRPCKVVWEAEAERDSRVLPVGTYGELVGWLESLPPRQWKLFEIADAKTNLLLSFVIRPYGSRRMAAGACSVEKAV